MGMEHLNDQEYQTLKSQGIAGLSDEAYNRLKLPSGYGHPGFADQMKQAAMSALSSAGNMAGQAVGALGEAAERVPVLREAGLAGKGLQEMVQGLREKSQGGSLEMFGNMAGGFQGEGGASSLIPNNALGAGLAMAPAIGKGLSAASEALAPSITSEALLGPSGTKNLAAGMKAMSGTSELNLRSALNDPSMLSEEGSSADVGSKINEWANQHEFGGLKTGSNARKAMPSVESEISPRTGTGHAEANKTWQRINDIENNAQQLSRYREHFDNSNQIAEDINKIKQGAGQEAEDIAFGGTSTAEDVRKSIAQKAGPLMEKNKADLQKLISARSVAGSLRNAPGLAAPTEVVDAKLATENLNRLDDVIRQTADSLKPGSGDEYSGLVDQYHRAKVRESMAPMFAQNANGSPSVLRIMAALQPASMGIAHGTPGSIAAGLGSSAATLAAESPAMQARAIRAAAYLKDFGKSLPSKSVGALASMMPNQAQAAGATGALNTLNAKEEK